MKNSYNNKLNTPDILTKKEKVISLAVMRNFLHFGHYELVSQMLKYSDVVYIAFGSAQAKNDIRNPFTIRQRIDLLKLAFGDTKKIKIISVADINAVSKEDWEKHVLKTIKTQGLQPPTDYFGGSEVDVSWYGNVISHTTEKAVGFETGDDYTIIKKYMKIHILDRYESNYMSGTDIRSSIANNGEEWKKHVPRCMISYIEENFPKHLILSNILKKKNIDGNTF